MQKLSQERAKFGLELLSEKHLKSIRSEWPQTIFEGLISHQDGRIDPITLLASLLFALKKQKVEQLEQSVIYLERLSNRPGYRWKVYLADGNSFKADLVIICTAMGTQPLLKLLGHNYELEPILGQAVEIKLKHNLSDWPAVLRTNGINLVPQNKNHILIGATLEPGIKPNPLDQNNMLKIEGNAPDWLKSAEIKNQWFGLRSRPKDQPAPLLKNLEPGLILATGHYRNGILLTPSTAKWVELQISNYQDS